MKFNQFWNHGATRLGGLPGSSWRSGRFFARARLWTAIEFRRRLADRSSLTYLVILRAFLHGTAAAAPDRRHVRACRCESAATPLRVRSTAFVTKLAAIAHRSRRSDGVPPAVLLVGQQLGITSTTAAAHAAIWIAGAAVPLLIWIGYLYLAGASQTTAPLAKDRLSTPLVHIQGGHRPARQGGLHSDRAKSMRTPATLPTCVAGRSPDARSPCRPPRCIYPPSYPRLPAIGLDVPVIGWIRQLRNRVIIHLHRFARTPCMVLMPMDFSASTYRDRLSKAFDSSRPGKTRGREGGHRGRLSISAAISSRSNTMRISELALNTGRPYAPYHLINAALNSPGLGLRQSARSQRGLLPVHRRCTSAAKRRIMPRRDALEQYATGLDLPEPQWRSRARPRLSNMGWRIRSSALTPTLALLNVRTGYWLQKSASIEPRANLQGRQVKGRLIDKLYLWSRRLPAACCTKTARTSTSRTAVISKTSASVRILAEALQADRRRRCRSRSGDAHADRSSALRTICPHRSRRDASTCRGTISTRSTSRQWMRRYVKERQSARRKGAARAALRDGHDRLSAQDAVRREADSRVCSSTSSRR